MRGPVLEIIAWLDAGPQGNHVAKVRRLCEGRTGVVLIDVAHDDWCDLLNYGTSCNCDPDVSLTLGEPC